jgi:hypothetical protein
MGMNCWAYVMNEVFRWCCSNNETHEGRHRGHSMCFNLELLNGGLGDESSVAR